MTDHDLTKGVSLWLLPLLMFKSSKAFRFRTPRFSTETTR